MGPSSTLTPLKREMSRSVVWIPIVNLLYLPSRLTLELLHPLLPEPLARGTRSRSNLECLRRVCNCSEDVCASSADKGCETDVFLVLLLSRRSASLLPLLSKKSLFRMMRLLPNAWSQTEQEKMEQLRKELPEIMNFGCDIKAKGVGYEVQRPKGSTDEPTVGDNLLGVGRFLLCLPLIERLRHGTEMERKTILKDVNATFKAGTTTLVLGAPGSGKVGAGVALFVKCDGMRRVCPASRARLQ